MVLVIAALVALAVLALGVRRTRGNADAASQEDHVRSTIESFDVAIQKGDLAALRGITCGATRESACPLRRPLVGRDPEGAVA